MKVSRLFVFISLFIFMKENGYCKAKKYFIITSKNGTECIIDTNNIELIPSGKYSKIWPLHDPVNILFGVADKDNRKGIYKLEEKEVLRCEFDDIGPFINNYGFIKRDGKWALLNSKLKRVTEFIFDEVSSFSGGRAWVKKSSQYCIIG